MLSLYFFLALACRQVFLTSTTYKGDVGNTAGADAKCNARAAAAGLSSPGSFVAWISNSSLHAKDHLLQGGVDGCWETTSGDLVANDKADLLDHHLLVPINRDEFGNVVTANAHPWTCTSSSGTRTSSDWTCLDWSSQSLDETGVVGDGESTTSPWSGVSVRSCHILSRLYCFSNAAPPTPQPTPPPTIFITPTPQPTKVGQPPSPPPSPSPSPASPPSSSPSPTLTPVSSPSAPSPSPPPSSTPTTSNSASQQTPSDEGSLATWIIVLVVCLGLLCLLLLVAAVAFILRRPQQQQQQHQQHRRSQRRNTLTRSSQQLARSRDRGASRMSRTSRALASSNDQGASSAPTFFTLPSSSPSSTVQFVPPSSQSVYAYGPMPIVGNYDNAPTSVYGELELQRYGLQLAAGTNYSDLPSNGGSSRY